MFNSLSRRRPIRCRPAAEPLEDRALLSLFTVDRLTDANPAGGEGKDLAGDLRYCITQANALPGDDAITISVKGTIQLAGALPFLSDLDIQGLGANSLTVRRNTGGNYGIFLVDIGATVVLSGLTITNGDAEYGGGIFNGGGTLTLNDVTVSGNTATWGGGIENNGMLTLNHSRVVGNTAALAGGGLDNYGGATATLNHSTVSGNDAEENGGGILNDIAILTLNHSTVSGNRALLSAGGIGHFGGTVTLNYSTVSGNSTTAAGVGVGGGIQSLNTAGPAALALNNSTVSGNFSSGLGGGISATGSTVTLNNSTISANYAVRTSGGIARITGTFSVRNTIIADNTAQFYPDVSGNLDSLGHNLIGNISGGSGFHETDLLDIDPLLGPLQDNGGPTETHALLPFSPAGDAGDPTDAPEWDQRGEGFSRVVGKNLDIGAYEDQGEGSGPSPFPPFDVAALVALQRSQGSRPRPWATE